jgi:glycosyltransferase involved in cell wall biosynthesis
MAIRKVLQICHGYDPPFLEVGNQYARIFGTDECEITTLYLSGQNSPDVTKSTIASKVLFFEQNSKSLRGLKSGLVKRLRALLKTNRYDMVICHRYKAIYLTGLASLGIRRFIWVGVVHDFKVFSKFSRKIFVRLLGKELNVLGVSQAIRDDVVKCCPALMGRTYNQPNSVAVDLLQAHQLSRVEARRVLDLDPEVFIFGTAGRLHPVKDHKTLLQAFAEKREYLANAIVVIMGAGKLDKPLKELSRELGIEKNIKFLGQVSEAQKYFKAFDVFVLPSIKEPFGLVLIEAMAAGVPVVSSRTGGTSEVVGDTGLLFSPGHVGQLAEQLVIAYNWSSDERCSYIEKAYERLNGHFSLQAFRDRFKRFPFYPSDNLSPEEG